jgi:Domain of Unknown Function (DUF748)
VGLLAALVLYAAAGYLLAPRLLADALVGRAAALGLTLTLREVRTNPFTLTVTLKDVELAGADGTRLATAPQAHADLAWASLWRDAWIAQRVRIDSPDADVVLHKGGLNWKAPEAGASAHGSSAAVRVNSLVIERGRLRFVDRSRGKPAEAVLQELALEIGNLDTGEGEAQYRLHAQLERGGALESSGTFSLAPLSAQGQASLADAPLASLWRLALPATEPPRGTVSARANFAFEHGRFRPLELLAQAALDSGGKLAARGTVDPRALAAELALEAASVPLPLAQRFLPESLALELASGRLSAKGRATVSRERFSYRGAAEVADLRLEEAGSDELLLGWKRARSDELAISTSPRTIEIGEVLVQAPEGRLLIDPEGRVNFAQLLRGNGATKEPLQASMRRLRLEKGTLHFADQSLETPVEVTMRELSGTVSGITTAGGEPARVRIEGRVGEYGLVQIRGTLDLHEPKALANINARLANVSLAQLTPYVVKFAGYRVRSGRASAELRYRVREGRLVGENQLVFQELELGEKVAGGGAPDLPLELAVALLADDKGRIRLDIPVRGNLNDPEFDFGGLIARAVRNVIARIASAPFRALAGLFGGKDGGLDAVRFEPGSAALTPPQEEQVAKLAQALAARPQLAVTVRGGYDPERDAAALRREAARREIAQRAGQRDPGALDLSDPKAVRAAEALYLERIGNRSTLRDLRDSAPRYGRALLDLLAYTLPEDAANPQSLGDQRAQAVRSALLEHGIDAHRVKLEPPSAEKGAEGGVPAQLTLGTRSGEEAATGATRR